MKKRAIVRYQGGLGNQMFEYSLSILLKENGYTVYNDLSFYDNKLEVMPFVLNDVFKNISVHNFLSSTFMTKILRRFYMIMGKYIIEDNYTKFDKDIFKHQGWIDGYWQSYKYYDSIRNKLLKEFTFDKITNMELVKIEKMILETEAVSIHVRAGDYLKPENYNNMGGVCNKAYYLKAVECIHKNIANPVFFVFSDDIEWAKNNIAVSNAIYLDFKKNSEYKDWMDMYFMSICKHNIIANSSFSWWGAWLNQNPDKFVISPQRWSNKYENTEVCPQGWIRL